MQLNAIVILLIGLLAQAFFSARILVQWILSERAKKVLSPSLFWIFSICGAYLLCVYGWLRDDFAIVLGQIISYYVYLWNLKIKGIGKKIPFLVRFLLIYTPICALLKVLENIPEVTDKFFANADVPLWLLIFGSLGQIIFTLRFIYQWYYSRKRGESELPAGFWILSLIGSLTIVSYGIIRRDPILILGQSFGVVAYIRNLMIGYKKLSSTNIKN